MVVTQDIIPNKICDSSELEEQSNKSLEKCEVENANVKFPEIMKALDEPKGKKKIAVITSDNMVAIF